LIIKPSQAFVSQHVIYGLYLLLTP